MNKFIQSEMDVRKKRDEIFKKDKDKTVVTNNKLLKALMGERENIFVQLKESNTAFTFEEIELTKQLESKPDLVAGLAAYSEIISNSFNEWAYTINLDNCKEEDSKGVKNWLQTYMLGEKQEDNRSKRDSAYGNRSNVNKSKSPTTK